MDEHLATKSTASAKALRQPEGRREHWRGVTMSSLDFIFGVMERLQ